MRRLLTPGWIAVHALVLVLTVVMVNLGFWQLRRHDEVTTENAHFRSNLEAPVAEADEIVLAPSMDEETVEAQRYRRVRLQGDYDPDGEVLWRNRTYKGQNGFGVLTPLVLPSGTVVLVDRGAVPFESDEPGDPAFAPAEGQVTVTGYLRAPQDQPGFGARDPEVGRLETVFNVDLTRLDEQIDGDLAGMWMVLQEQEPAQAVALPEPADDPTFSAGSHMSYAVQWFSFATILAVGYVLWHRKQLRGEDDSSGSEQDRPAREATVDATSSREDV